MSDTAPYTAVAALLGSLISADRGPQPAGKRTVTALAKACNVSRAAASQWLNGKTLPEEFRLRSIADFLNVPVRRLENARKADVGLSEVAILLTPDQLEVWLGEENPNMNAADRIVSLLESLLRLLHAQAERQEQQNADLNAEIQRLTSLVERSQSSAQASGTPVLRRTTRPQ